MFTQKFSVAYITWHRETIPMRDKEKVHDYRFMPEPNLPPLHIYNDVTMPTYLQGDQVVNIDDLKRKLPPLPAEVRARLQEDYGLSLEHANTIMVCAMFICHNSSFSSFSRISAYHICY